jgi:hypothetical protein
LIGPGWTSKAPRRLALLLIAVVAFGAYTLSPAIGGSGRLTVQRAKQLFFTKLQANNRFFSKAVADARFLPRQRGEYEFTIDPYEWEGTGRTEEGGFVSFTDVGSDQLTLHEGNLPSRFAGKGLRLSGIEVCFEPDNAAITHFTVERFGPILSDPIPGPVTFYDRDESLSVPECHLFSSPASPVNGAGVIDLTATVTYDGAGSINIGRTTALFIP